MKRRLFVLALASALTLSLLTACGNGGTSSGTSNQENTSQSQPDTSTGGNLSLPDTSQPEGSQSSSSEQPDASQEQPDASQPEQTRLTLNRTDFSLFTVGSTFRLKAAGVPDGTTVTWASSDEAIATVGEDGTVTYVSAGSVTITASAGELTASCKVYCKAQESTEEPDNSDSSSSSGGSSSEGGSSSQSVDLKAFADSVIADYQLPFMSTMDNEMLSNFLPGLSDLSVQLAAYTCQMSPSPAGDLVLVEVKDSKDVASVKDIFQARVDYMAGDDENPGAAWYPEPIRMWKEDSRIVSNGNYVMLVVSSQCDSIVKDFNALF